MTKEELLNLVKSSLEFRDDENVLRLEDLHKFFESNVCIPKGANRHHSADVLHAWIEGAEMQSGSSDRDFIDYGISCIDSFQFKYRIKPSEPIYEWQWLMCPVFGGVNSLTPMMTDSEFNSATKSRGHNYTKLEETKKERK